MRPISTDAPSVLDTSARNSSPEAITASMHMPCAESMAESRQVSRKVNIVKAMPPTSDRLGASIIPRRSRAGNMLAYIVAASTTRERPKRRRARDWSAMCESA
eukprot:7391156-Prymnesium_polylepis.2